MSVLQNLKDPVRLQCKRCGREWMYHGRNPYRARCTYCGTTVMVGSSRVDTIIKIKEAWALLGNQALGFAETTTLADRRLLSYV